MRVGLTTYCIHTWVGRRGPEHQTDVAANQNLSCNCDNLHFFNLAGHFWGPRRPFLGLIFSAHVILCVHVCKILQITKTRSPISSIPQELSNAYENDEIGACSHLLWESRSIRTLGWFLYFLWSPFLHESWPNTLLYPYMGGVPRTWTPNGCGGSLKFELYLR
jgi:hypothetical protein